MAETQWDKVGELLEKARERPPDERAAFLEEACEEEPLRNEVLSLLKAEEEASGFFDGLASALPSVLGEEEPGSEGADPLELEGKDVGRYRIEEHLGSGGMGAVYKARDSKLGRAVALKFLPPHLTAHPEAEERFLREARAAAALGHPNIATVHDIGETEENRRFIAMAFYEGETLKEKLDREGTLPIEEALGYAEQIAEALARAHEAGIVHRDVKPANVMVTEAGEVKLLDFGLAKAAAETRLTDPGQQMGTAAYMSPEQAEGKEVDARTDLWALGALLYEMLAGERPFEGARKSAIIHSILHDEPAPLSERRDEVPSALEQVVHRCLQKDPEERYASADRLLDDLRAAQSETESVLRPGKSGLWRRRGLVGGAATILLILVVAALWGPRVTGPTGSTAPESAEHSVAVLPFEVSGSGAEEWQDGMVTALSMNLDGTPNLRAIPSRTIFAILEERGQAEEGLGTQEALAVAREVGARYAIVGSALQLSGDLRLSGAVHRTTSGERLGRVEVRGAPDSAMTLATDLTRKVLGVLLEKSDKQVPSVRLESITTESLDAFKDFLEGERHYRAGDFEAAANAFEAATRKDSTFALAYARHSLSKKWAEGSFAAGDRSLERAYELSDRLPRRERRLVRGLHLSTVQENQSRAAADTLRRLTEAYPDDPMVWYSLGLALFYTGVPGGWLAADRALKRAVELDPGHAMYYYNYAILGIAVHHDSALAAERIAAIPKKQWREAFRVPLNLVFGDSATQKAALARYDSVRGSGGMGVTLAYALKNPLDIEHREALLQREARKTALGAAILFHTRLEGGQVNKALAQLQEKGLDVNPGFGAWTLARSLSVGIPVPDSVLQARLDPSQLGEDPSELLLEGAGLYLAAKGWAEELASFLDRIREELGQNAELVQELKGYRAFKAGELKRAEELWAGLGQGKFHFYGAIWRGDLYRRLGQLEKAEGWYQLAWRHPVAHERLGWLYEEMGKPKKAAAAYRRFIAGWKNADPALQDRVEKARERLDALGETKAAE